MYSYKLLALSIVFKLTVCNLKEPKCLSQFDYEHKLLYKLIKIEEEVKHFRSVIDELKKSQKQTEHEQKDKLEDTLAKFKEDVDSEFSSLPKFRKEMEELLSNFRNSTELHLQEATKKGNAALIGMKEDLDKFKDNPGKAFKRQAIGFSVTGPKDSLISSQITFTNVITNWGNLYDTATGVFTCNLPGFYYFSLSLLKQPRFQTNVQCGITVNDVVKVFAYVKFGGSGKSYLAGVNSLFVHLSTGDTVKLTGCTAISGMDSLTSFSGFLVTPDN